MILRLQEQNTIFQAELSQNLATIRFLSQKDAIFAITKFTLDKIEADAAKIRALEERVSELQLMAMSR